MLNIVLFGAPGAGKGTQSGLLVKKYKLFHISPGEIFRQEQAADSALGKMISSYMNEGNLVPEGVVVKTVNQAIKKHIQAKGFLFDGYPRSLHQADALALQLRSLGHTLDLVLHIQVDKAELTQRILCRKSIEARLDDDKFAHRLALYEAYAKPLLAYYKEKGLLVDIVGKGSIEDVFERIEQALKAFSPSQPTS